MKYRERIYQMCQETDMSNTAEAIELAQILAHETVQANEYLKAYEDELKKHLTAKQFEDIVTAVSQTMFKKIINEMEDCDFKKCTLEHMDDILGGDTE